MKKYLFFTIFAMFLASCAPAPLATPTDVSIKEETSTRLPPTEAIVTDAPLPAATATTEEESVAPTAATDPLQPTPTGEFDYWLARQNPVSGLGWSADGKLLVTRSNSGLYVLDLESGKVVHTLDESGFLHPFTVDAQNKRVFAGNKVWDIASGQLLYTLDGIQPSAAAFSPQGDLLAIGQENQIAIWDANAGSSINTIGAGLGNPMFGLAFSANGETVYAMYDLTPAHPIVRSINLADGKSTDLFEPTEGSIFAVFSPDASQMIVNVPDHGSGHKELWDVKNGRLLLPSDRCDSDVSLYTFRTDGKQFVIGPCGPNTELWDAQSQKLLFVFPIPAVEGWNPEWRGGAFSPDSRYLALGNDLGQIMIIDLTTYNLVQTLSIPFTPQP